MMSNKRGRPNGGDDGGGYDSDSDGDKNSLPSRCKKKQKAPQRGPGIKQLEKMRLELEKKKIKENNQEINIDLPPSSDDHESSLNNNAAAAAAAAAGCSAPSTSTTTARPPIPSSRRPPLFPYPGGRSCGGGGGLSIQSLYSPYNWMQKIQQPQIPSLPTLNLFPEASNPPRTVGSSNVIEPPSNQMSHTGQPSFAIVRRQLESPRAGVPLIPNPMHSYGPYSAFPLFGAHGINAFQTRDPQIGFSFYPNLSQFNRNTQLPVQPVNERPSSSSAPPQDQKEKADTNSTQNNEKPEETEDDGIDLELKI